MNDPRITLTGAQVREISKIIDEFDPATIDIEGTNIHGVIVVSYRTSSVRTMLDSVLISEDGNTMLLQ